MIAQNGDNHLDFFLHKEDDMLWLQKLRGRP